MLRPVYQRSYEGQLLRTRLRLRTSLVEARRSLINQVRGTLRAHGAPLSSCTSKSFVAHFATGPAPQDLREVLEPMVGAIGELTDRIEAIERELVEKSHSDELIERLQEVPGVGLSGQGHRNPAPPRPAAASAPPAPPTAPRLPALATRQPPLPTQMHRSEASDN
jgi:transposase